MLIVFATPACNLILLFFFNVDYLFQHMSKTGNSEQIQSKIVQSESFV